MKLYGNHRSPFVRKVRIVAAEKGLPIELSIVELDRRDATFYALAPIGRIPVLQHDGHTIPDSSLICEYLEDHFPNPPLYERDRLRCRVLEEYADSLADFAVQAWHARSRGDAEGDARALRGVDRLLGHLSVRMERGDWPAGFTIADAALVAATGYLTYRHGDGWRGKHPVIAVHADRHAHRPSVVATPIQG